MAAVDENRPGAKHRDDADRQQDERKRQLGIGERHDHAVGPAPAEAGDEPARRLRGPDDLARPGGGHQPACPRAAPAAPSTPAGRVTVTPARTVA